MYKHKTFVFTTCQCYRAQLTDWRASLHGGKVARLSMYNLLYSHPTYQVNVITLKWQIIWTGGLPHLKAGNLIYVWSLTACSQALRITLISETNVSQEMGKKCSRTLKTLVYGYGDTVTIFGIKQN